MNKLELLKDIDSTIGEETFDPAEPLPEKAFHETLEHQKVLEFSLNSSEYKGVWKVFNNLSGLKSSTALMFHTNLLKSSAIFFGVLASIGLFIPVVLKLLSSDNPVDVSLAFFLFGLAIIFFGLTILLAFMAEVSKMMKKEALRLAQSVLVNEYARQVNVWAKNRYGVELESVFVQSQSRQGFLYLGGTLKTSSLFLATTEGEVVEAKYNNGWVLTQNVKTSELPLIQSKS